MNRVDFIDGVLCCFGRFDCELVFLFFGVKARGEILCIYIKVWE